MQDYVITCFYNYFDNEKSRRICQLFMIQNKNVHLIEAVLPNQEPVIKCKNKTVVRLESIEGFINNKLINQFVKDHWNTLNSLTFIDCDLVLPKDFFTNLRCHLNGFRDECIFIQPWSKCSELLDNPRIQSVPYKSCAYMCNKDPELDHPSGHTGYMYVYNRPLLEQIGKLPESMLLGGFDSVLWMMLFNRPEIEITELIDNVEINKELMQFYERIRGTRVDFGLATIQHRENGSKRLRYSGRFGKYRNLSPEIIIDYFKQRNENEYSVNYDDVQRV